MRKVVALAFMLWGISLTLMSQNGLFFSGDKLSSTIVTSICQDKVGYVWVGTEYGLNRFDGYTFTVYKNNPQDTTSLMFNMVNKVFCDKDGNLWIGTNIGLQRYDYQSDRFLTYHYPTKKRGRVSDICQMPDGSIMVATSGAGLYRVASGSNTLSAAKDFQIDGNDIFFNHVYVDSDGAFWSSGIDGFSIKRPGQRPQSFTSLAALGKWDASLIEEPPTSFVDIGGKILMLTRNALIVYDNGHIQTDYFDLSEITVPNLHFLTVMRDHQGNVFIGTRGNGLLWIPRGSHKVQRYVAYVPGINMSTTNIRTIMEDRQGNIWIDCRRRGLLMIPSHKPQFTTWSFSNQKKDIGNYVSSVCKGDGGMIWCTVQNEGVFGFNAEGRLVSNPLSPKDVEFIGRDHQNKYYLGTGSHVYEYDPLTGRSRQIIEFVSDKLNMMADDKHGHLFFIAFGKGVLRYDQKTEKTQLFTQTNDSTPEAGRMWNDWVMEMIADRNGRIWMATTNGVCCYDDATHSFKPFGWNVLLDGTRCESLCETKQGDMLIGTMEGIYAWKRSTGALELLPNSQPLKGINIAHIVQDQDGDIWCSTSNGIWHYRVSDQKWISHISGSGLTAKEYVAQAGLYTAEDNTIYFPTSDGITTFTPQQVRDVATELGEIKLTNMSWGGQQVSTFAEDDHFTLPYTDHVISLQFSLMNFLDAANTVFEYRMDSNGEWMRNSEGQNTVSFTRLPSGEYHLEVRAIVGGIVSPSRTFVLTIAAPWYRSPIAYMIYILGLIGLTGLLGTLWRRHLRQQLDEEKMKFLINATHDIRSPLTLILSPIDKLKNEKIEELKSIEELHSFNSSILQPSIKVIDSNAHRIMDLVNQILDIRKIDKQQMRLQCRETNMVDFVTDICSFFEFNAQERNITFTFNGHNIESLRTRPDGQDATDKALPTPVTAWIDRTQFDKVVSNLLSNAFKYSFDQGNIDVSITTGYDDKAREPLKDYVELTVTDNGSGMRDDTLKHLFDRFYQGKSAKSSHVEGTGIGLNLCKMIVEMHHGTIHARNRADGHQGSVFTVRIPQGCAHLSKEEIDNNAETSGAIKLSNPKKTNSNQRLLLVDDDEELARYIGQELSPYYHITICCNGKDALKELLSKQTEDKGEQAYNIVISDVMMPEMDGFTLLRLIKTNTNISHIPVIMLTSKTDVGNRLEGLEKGADAYLTKPFNLTELHLTIDNLIAKYLLLKGKYSGAQHPKQYIEDIEVKSNDEMLLERIMKCINDHFSDETLDSNLICKEACISRSHLHRKMKELTGLPISDFIQNLRLEQAARLLVEQKQNITQVAYSVGYSYTSTFSTAFKKHFGVSPTEYIKQHQQ
ncbi:MAG: helix-turn-helix domain-containing protein [Prevotella sp.]|nr:helix-turn-helix domain-containing protein [Prevotella sp.]